MAVYSYAIGLTQETLANVETLCGAPPVGYFQPYGRVYTLATGETVGDGFPVIRWRFELISSAGLQELRDLCPGASRELFITTRKDDETFGTFQAIMHWPLTAMGRRTFRGYYRDFEIEFTHAQEIT